MKRLKVLQLPLDQIDPPNVQLRDLIDPDALKALADSMARMGLLQPIRVRAQGDRWTIVAGHRRYLAAAQLRWLTIDAIPTDGTDQDAIAKSAHENLYREDLTPLEEAALIDYLRTTERLDLGQIAVALSRSPEWCEGRVALLRYPPPLQQAIHEGHVPLAATVHLASINDPDQLAIALEAARTHGMTARSAMEWARQYELYAQARQLGAPAIPPDPALVAAEVSKTFCDVCEGHVYLNVTKILRICFDCLQAFTTAMRAH